MNLNTSNRGNPNDSMGVKKDFELDQDFLAGFDVGEGESKEEPKTEAQKPIVLDDDFLAGFELPEKEMPVQEAPAARAELGTTDQQPPTEPPEQPSVEAAPAAPEPAAGGTIDKDFTELKLLEAADDYQRKEESGFYDRVLMVTNPDDGTRWKVVAEDFDAGEIALEAENTTATRSIRPEELIGFPYEYQETQPRFEVRFNGEYLNVEAGKNFGWNIAEDNAAEKTVHFTVEAIAFNRERNKEDDRVEIKFANQEACVYSAAEWQKIFQEAEEVEGTAGNLQTPSSEVRLSDVFDRILAGSMQKEIQAFRNGQRAEAEEPEAQVPQFKAPGAEVVPAEIEEAGREVVERVEEAVPEARQADRQETAAEEGEPPVPAVAEGGEQPVAETAPQPPPAAAETPAGTTQTKRQFEEGQGNIVQDADRLEETREAGG